MTLGEIPPDPVRRLQLPAAGGKPGALEGLERIIERLRGPEGCPWDRKQTLQSLAPNFLEEACELIDAIGEAPAEDAPRSASICEELGDVLMNVFLAARVAEEAGGFDLAQVAETVSDKLVRRHPHVFGDERIQDVQAVLSRWESIKSAEKPERAAAVSVLDRVPRSLPPLSAAHELGRRAAQIGFDWERAPDVLDKVREEVAEVAACLAAGQGAGAAADGDPARLRAELGDLLFAVVQLARQADISPEEALREANRKFERRFRAVESAQRARTAAGGPAMTLAEMEALWQDCKKLES